MITRVDILYSGSKLGGRSAHHDDFALGGITAVRQDGQDGGRVQQPVDHVDDPVGRHDVSTRQTDSFVPQQDVPLRTDRSCWANNSLGF